MLVFIKLLFGLLWANVSAVLNESTHHDIHYSSHLHHISSKDVHVPTLFIIGAQKCATTSLYDLYASKHPNICRSSEKEIHYFDRKVNWNRGAKFYSAHFVRDKECNVNLNNKNPDQRTFYIDSTPDYFYDLLVPKRIFASYGPAVRKQLKFVLILREPVAREFSFYNHRARFCVSNMHKYIKNHPNDAARVKEGSAQWNGEKLCAERHCTDKCHLYATTARLNFETEAIANFTQYMEDGEIKLMKSEYAFHIENWLTYFNRNQLFIVNWKTLIVNTTDTLERMNRFLGIPQFPKKLYDKGDGMLVLPRDNAARINTTFDCAARMRLYSHYAPHNQKLYELLRHHHRNDKLEPPFPEFEITPCTEGQLF